MELVGTPEIVGTLGKLVLGRAVVGVRIGLQKESWCGPGWFGSVGKASAFGLKSSGFDSGRGHVPRLWAQFPVGDVWEEAKQ